MATEAHGGSNRNTGKTVDAPKTHPVNLVRTYDLGSGDTLHVDVGTYELIDRLRLSGDVDQGLGLDQDFTIAGTNATFGQARDWFDEPALIDLDNADGMNISGIDLMGATHGIWTHRGSDDLVLGNLRAFDQTSDGMLIQTQSPNTTFANLSSTDAGSRGIVIIGAVSAVTGLNVSGSGADGIVIDATTETLQGFTVANAGGRGIVVTGASGTLSAFDVDTTGGDGIAFTGDADRLSNFTTRSTAGNGIVVTGNVPVLEEFTAEQAAGDGIVVTGTADTLSYFTANDEGGDGISLTGVFGDLIDPEASRNGGVGLRAAILTGVGGQLDLVTGGTFSENDYGAYLELAPPIDKPLNFEESWFELNRIGIYADIDSSERSIIGAQDLDRSAGNVFYQNSEAAADLRGNVLFVGNAAMENAMDWADQVSVTLRDGADAFDNVIGTTANAISTYGGDVRRNYIFDFFNTGVIAQQFDSEIADNWITGSTDLYTFDGVFLTGIKVLSATHTITHNVIEITGELPWTGIAMLGGNDTAIVNNTLAMASGGGSASNAGVLLDGGENVTILNNIFTNQVESLVNSGINYPYLAINVEQDNGFISDFNLFDLRWPDGNPTPPGPVGRINGVFQHSLEDWRLASGQDQNSFAEDAKLADKYHPDSAVGVFAGATLSVSEDPDTWLPLRNEVADPVEGQEQSPAVDGGTGGVLAEITPNGDKRNIGAYGGTRQASLSSGLTLHLMTPAPFDVVYQNSTVDITWSGGDADVSYSLDDGATWTGIGHGTNSLSWTVDPALYPVSAQYLLKIQNDTLVDQMTFPFMVVAEAQTGVPTGVFYVDDQSDVGDLYTPGVFGDDNNDGLTPETPMASIQAVLDTYDLAPGDVILVDTGSYDLTTGIVIGAEDSGDAVNPIIISGPNSGPGAELHLNDQSNGAVAVTFDGADHVTLQNLVVGDAWRAIQVNDGSEGIVLNHLTLTEATDVLVAVMADGTVIENTDLSSPTAGGNGVLLGTDVTNVALRHVSMSNLNTGILSETGGNDGLVLTDVQIGNLGYIAGSLSGAGMRFSDLAISRATLTVETTGSGAAVSSITNSEFSGGADTLLHTIGSVDLIGNSFHDNYSSYGLVRVEGGGDASHVVSGNEFVTAYTALTLDDPLADVFDNRFVRATFGAKLAQASFHDNVLSGNGLGVLVTGSALSLHHNRFFDNGSAIKVDGASGIDIYNSDFLQGGAQAIWVTGNSEDVTVHENIFVLYEDQNYDVGSAFRVDSNSQTGFASDWNLFQFQDSSTFGRWSSQYVDDLAAWAAASGNDANSLEADPMFVDRAGPDGVAGYDWDQGVDRSADDDLRLMLGSPAIDRGNPLADFNLEPEDNGNRVDIGWTGNSSNAGAVSTSTNTAPVAVAGTASVNEDGSVAVSLSGTDIDGDALSYAIVSGPSHGAISGFDAAAGTFTYTPDADFNGTDTLSFSVTDPSNASDQAAVTITVNPVNDQPVAVAGTASVNEDGSVAVSLSGTDIDGDALSYAIVSGPSHGAISGFDAAAGTFTYTPDADFNGTDTLSFSVTDPSNASDQAAVTLTVNPVNDQPVAVAGTASVNEDGSVAVSLSGTDIDGDALSYAIVSGPSHGAISGFDAAAGTFTYTPDADFNGTDTLSFSVTDPSNASDQAAVTLTVNPVNDQPVAVAGMASVNEDGSVAVSLSGTDADGDALSYAIVSGPSHGAISGFDAAAGTFTYTPDADFNGTDTLSFSVTDPSNASDQAQLTITVDPVNDLPTLAPIADITLTEGNSVSIPINATDIDSDLIYSILSGPAYARIEGDVLVLSPERSNNAPDTLVLRATERDGAHQIAETSFEILVENRPPVLDVIDASSTSINRVFDFAVAFDDAPGDTHTAQIDWGDGTWSVGSISNGSLFGTHIYQEAGDFTITATIEDDSGASATAQGEVHVGRLISSDGDSSGGIGGFFDQSGSGFGSSPFSPPSNSGLGFPLITPLPNQPPPSQNASFGWNNGQGFSQGVSNRWTQFDDVVSGSQGNDTLGGGEGNDLFRPGSGNDVVRGGPGRDTVELDGDSSDFVITYQDGAFTVRPRPDGAAAGQGRDTLIDVEVLRFADGRQIELNPADFAVPIRGDAGNNALVGGSNPDRLIPGAGDDTVDAGAGNDLVIDGPGNDVIDGGDGQDIVALNGNASDYSIVVQSDGSYVVTDNRPGPARRREHFAQCGDTSFRRRRIPRQLGRRHPCSGRGPFTDLRCRLCAPRTPERNRQAVQTSAGGRCRSHKTANPAGASSKAR